MTLPIDNGESMASVRTKLNATIVNAEGVLTFLVIGQSNGYGNDAIAGDNYAPRDSIKAFNRTSGNFEQWQLDNPTPFPGMNGVENFIYRFAQQMEKRGANTRFVFSTYSGHSITNWLPVTGANMIQLEADLVAGNVDRVDGVIWAQGESDGFAMAATTYQGHLETIRDHLDGIFSDSQIQWVIMELAASNDVGNLGAQDSKNRVFDSYADDPRMMVMPNRFLPTKDDIHFTGASLVKMGGLCFNAFNGNARTPLDPDLYHQWREEAFGPKDYPSIVNVSGGTNSIDTGYLRMFVGSPTAGVRAYMKTTGFALRVDSGQSSRFDLYGARLKFRIPSGMDTTTSIIVGLGVHPSVDFLPNFTAASKGVQVRFSRTGVAIATSDGTTLTEATSNSGIGAGVDIEELEVEIRKNKVFVYRQKENSGRNIMLDCGGVPQGDYLGFYYAAGIGLRGDTGLASSQNTFIDNVRLALRRYAQDE